MAAIYSRIFIFYNLIYTIFLCILPKKLKQHFPIPKSHNQKPQDDIVSQIQTPRPSRMNPEELQITFQMFDKNGDGRITKQELNDSLQKMAIFITDEDLVQMIEKIDVNGDGCVDLGEFGELYKTIMNNREDEEDMLDAFNVFDQNRDGFIAVEELRSVLETLGIGKQGRESDDCRRMIMKVDRDGDGLVSFSEFKQMMRSGGFAQIEQN